MSRPQESAFQERSRCPSIKSLIVRRPDPRSSPVVKPLRSRYRISDRAVDRNGKAFTYQRLASCRVLGSGREAAAMIAFMKRFPELGWRETRTASFPDDDGLF